jgi:hypothetical protein
MTGIRRDVALLVDRVGPRAMALVVVGCAVLGAVVGAVSEVVHQYGLPHSPKGTPK